MMRGMCSLWCDSPVRLLARKPLLPGSVTDARGEL